MDSLFRASRLCGPGRRGLTLVEVLVAFAVLVPVVVVAAGVLPFFRLSSARAWTQVAAADLAREQMERARGTTFASLVSIADQRETRNGTDYRWTMTVTPVGDGTWRKRVVVNVAWQNPQSQNLAFETVVARAVAQPTPTPDAAATTSTASSPASAASAAPGPPTGMPSPTPRGRSAE